MKTRLLHLIGVTILLLVTLGASAADSGIIGNWVTWNNKTDSVGSVVQFFVKDNQYVGKIVKAVHPDKRCTQCSGDQYNHPMMGLILVRNVSTTLSNGRYPGGWILDPETGKEYSCSLQLAEGGQELKVKVTKGIFSRTVVWKREKN